MSTLLNNQEEEIKINRDDLPENEGSEARRNDFVRRNSAEDAGRNQDEEDDARLRQQLGQSQNDIDR